MPATNPSLPHARNLIGGQWVDSPKRGTAHSPATGAVIGTYGCDRPGLARPATNRSANTSKNLS